MRQVEETAEEILVPEREEFSVLCKPEDKPTGPFLGRAISYMERRFETELILSSDGYLIGEAPKITSGKHREIFLTFVDGLLTTDIAANSELKMRRVIFALETKGSAFIEDGHTEIVTADYYRRHYYERKFYRGSPGYEPDEIGSPFVVIRHDRNSGGSELWDLREAI